jgi:hypothetical protein
MRIVLTIIGGLLTLMGVIWFLQGINVLPGSFMSGQTKWAVNGGIAAVVGIGLLVFGNRGRQR